MLSFIKDYLRIDFIDDDALLTTLEEMAKEFIFNSTGYTVEYVKSIEKIAVAMLVGHWYENRAFVVDTGAVPQKIPLTIQSILTQLQNTVVEPI
mgnify:CR=1 FL=1